MFTILGGDGKEYGPASAEQLRGWIKAGRANLETQARSAGTDEWRRLGDFAEFSAPDAPPPLGAAPALSAPAPYAGPTDTASVAAELIARADKIDVFGCLDRSFQLWKNNFFPLVGVTLLVLVAQMALGMIPILGSIAGLFLNGVFYGGLYYYYIGKLRGEHRELGDAFAGFSKAFVPLMLASLITAALTIAIMMICAGPLFISLVKAAIESGHTNTLPDLQFSPLSIAGLIIGVIAVFYLSVGWAFTFALVIDKGLGPWTAMEVSRRVVTKQWFRVFAVVFLGAILTLLGLLGLIIGIFFTMPLIFGAILSAYETLCNPPPKQ
jgi:hypothetical protein